MEQEEMTTGMLNDLTQNESYDYHKVASVKRNADETSLVVAGQSHLALPTANVPTVKTSASDRQSKRAADNQVRALQAMAYETQRYQFAIKTIKVVLVTGQTELDEVGEHLMSRFLGISRSETMNKMMAEVTSQLLAIANQGIMALCKSFPGRVAEEL